MTKTFAILASFLDQLDGEVEGRALESPPEPVKQQLRDLARGALPESDLGPLLAQLEKHRHWLPLLAAEVKALRPRAQETGR